MGERRAGRGRLYCWFERVVLSAGMSAVAFVVERRLTRAIRQGNVKPAPRTAAGDTEALGEFLGLDTVPDSTPAPEDVPDQP